VLCSSMVVGGLMIAKGMVLVVSGDPQAAYATAGALKPTHAVTMHGVLVLPLLARLLSFSRFSERRQLAVVVVASAGYVLLAVVVAVANVLGYGS
jgi:formate-dependent nitrite reductase membrane component NrfD